MVTAVNVNCEVTGKGTGEKEMNWNADAAGRIVPLISLRETEQEDSRVKSSNS